eukprot:2887566-Rhodomonas_salina.3
MCGCSCVDLLSQSSKYLGDQHWLEVRKALVCHEPLHVPPILVPQCAASVPDIAYEARSSFHTVLHQYRTSVPDIEL